MVFRPRDEIKKLGYSWSYLETMDVAFSIKSTEKYWNKVILISNLENELEKAVSLGATPATQKEDLFSFASYFMVNNSRLKSRA